MPGTFNATSAEFDKSKVGELERGDVLPLSNCSGEVTDASGKIIEAQVYPEPEVCLNCNLAPFCSASKAERK